MTTKGRILRSTTTGAWTRQYNLFGTTTSLLRRAQDPHSLQHHINNIIQPWPFHHNHQCRRTFANKSKHKKKSSSSPGNPRKKKTNFSGGKTRGWKATTKTSPKQQKQKQRRQPKLKESDEPRSRFIPPALLLPTASRFVYISRAAFGEEEEDPLSISKTIFSDVVAVDKTDDNDNDKNTDSENNNNNNHTSSTRTTPQPFRGMTFEYFPPKSFQHELPQAIDSNNGERSGRGGGPKIIPEVAFLGRSNVGKSSLINSLMKKDLARCSKHPGRTQQPYYYGLVPKGHDNKQKKAAAFIVDLPGYGFALAPEKNVDEWQKHTQQFLQNRRDAETLQRLFLLVDARRGLAMDDSVPNAIDLAVMRWMDEQAVPYTVVITKADCVAQPQLVRVANEACMRYYQQAQAEYEQIQQQQEDESGGGVVVAPEDVEPAGYMSPFVHLTSARKGDGLPELRSAVEAEFVQFK